MVVMEDRLLTLLAPVVEGMGVQLWGIEHIVRGRHVTLRIYVDAAKGIDISDCERVSRQVSSVLDVEEPIAGHYTLEVSSPGLERRLYRIEHYRRYIGYVVRVMLKRPFEGRRRFSGVLTGLEDDTVIIQADGEEYLLPFEMIDKGRLVATD